MIKKILRGRLKFHICNIILFLLASIFSFFLTGDMKKNIHSCAGFYHRHHIGLCWYFISSLFQSVLILCRGLGRVTLNGHIFFFCHCKPQHLVLSVLFTVTIFSKYFTILWCILYTGDFTGDFIRFK